MDRHFEKVNAVDRGQHRQLFMTDYCSLIQDGQSLSFKNFLKFSREFAHQLQFSLLSLMLKRAKKLN